MIDLKSSLRLYLVADPDHYDGNLLEATRVAIFSGVTMVQLRAKSLSDREFLQLARMMRAVCVHVPFIVNDRVDIARTCNADGVHLGVDDLPLESARALGGERFIVGYSPETDADLESAKSRGANYLGIGPVFGTASKGDAGAALGLDEFARRTRLGALPTVGIGGISSENAASVLQHGADGVAVISAILGAEDPARAAAQISTNLKY